VGEAASRRDGGRWGGPAKGPARPIASRLPGMPLTPPLAQPIWLLLRGPARLARLLVIACVAWGLACASEPPGLGEARVLTEQGDVSLALGRAAEAEHAYRAALLQRSDFAQAQRGLAQALAANGEAEAAIAAFEVLALQHPALFADFANRYCLLLGPAADAARSAERPGDAVALARKRRAAPCQAPEHDALLAGLLRDEAAAARTRGSEDEANALYRAAIEADRRDPDLHRAAALALFSAGRRDDALSLLTEALRLHPLDRPLHVLTVDVLSGRPPAPEIDLAPSLP